MSASESSEGRARDVCQAARLRLRQIRAERVAKPRTIVVSARQTVGVAPIAPAAAGGETLTSQTESALPRAAANLIDAAAAWLTSQADRAPAALAAEAAGSQTGDVSGIERRAMGIAPQTIDTAGAAFADAGPKLSEIMPRAPEDADAPSSGAGRTALIDDAGSRAAASAEPDLAEMGPGPDLDPAPAGPDDTDLCQLPGAGDGLVWLLQQKGIHSLADLAQADAAALATRLELVGKLIDLDGWIAFARARNRA